MRITPATYLKSCLVLTFGLSTFSAFAQTTQLIADEFLYNDQANTVAATGNVEVFADGYRYQLENVSYNIDTEQVYVPDMLWINTPDGTRISANRANLSFADNARIAAAARLRLPNQVQITGQEIQDETDYTYIFNGVASSCQICFEEQTPLWQFRATKAIRDKKQQKIYFENMRFEVIGVPIFYSPTFRIPDPTATRMDGFLQPELSFSSVYGTGIRLPYFYPFDAHSDVTLTPYITTENLIMLEGEYRREIRNGRLDLIGAHAIQDINGESGRGFLTAEFRYNALPYGLTLSARGTYASDKTFIPQHDYDNPSTDFLRLERLDNYNLFTAEYRDYRALNDGAREAEQPTLSPYIDYTHYNQISENMQAVFNLNFVGLTREGEQDVTRFGAIGSLNRTDILPFGVIMQSYAGLQGDLYQIDQGAEIENAQRFTPHLGVDLSLPLVKQGLSGQHIISPRAQLNWSENIEEGEILNTDSLYTDFDFAALFSRDRFVGRDRNEAGLRTNLGLRYDYLSDESWQLSTGIGRVIRLTEDPQFEEISGLDREYSDWVSFAEFTYQDNITASLRNAFDSQFEISRSEIALGFETKDFIADINWVRIGPEATSGTREPREDMLISGSYRFHPNMEATTLLRHDLADDQFVEQEFGLTYGNECIELTFGVDRDFSRQANVEPETSYSFSFQLLGIGGTPKHDWPARKCLREL